MYKSLFTLKHCVSFFSFFQIFVDGTKEGKVTGWIWAGDKKCLRVRLDTGRKISVCSGL